MARQINSKVLFVTTSPRSPEKMIPEIELLVNHFEGKVWNRTTQTQFMELLREYDFFEGEGAKDPAFSARDRINRAPKALGFISLQPTISLTPSGKQLLETRQKGEVFLRQLLKFQIPSPYHQPTGQATIFRIKPYLEIFRLIRKLGTLKFDELQIFGMQLTDYTKFNQIVDKILSFRKEVDKHKGSYRQFRSKILKAELKCIFRDRIESGRTKTRESADKSIEKFLNTQARNMRDYADACFRYLRATGLVKVSYQGKSLSIDPNRIKDVDFILDTIEREPSRFNTQTEYVEYLGSDVLPVLLSDNREQLARKISNEFPQNRIPENFSLQQLKDVYSQLQEQQKQSSLQAQIDSLKHYKHYEDVQAIFEQIKSKELYDAPLMLEWNMWRAMTMLDGGQIKANLHFDDNGAPLSNASGNMSDIVCDYGDFYVNVEVTISTGNRQFEMEGESVLRHLGKMKQTTDKPCYCLFVAPSISPSCISYFYTLHHLTLKNYGGTSTIIPLPLPVFQQLLANSSQAEQAPTPDSIKDIFEASQRIATHAENENDWYDQIQQYAINRLK